MDIKDFDWKKHITLCMQSTDYCTIATVDPKGVWSSPVYFAWDSEFDMYFISRMSSRHMQNLKKCPRISVSVYKTEQKGDVVGIQIEGTAQILSQKADVQHAYEVYFGRAGHGPDVQEYKKDPIWLYVRILPEYIYYFDTRFFDEDRQPVPKDKLFLK